MPINPIEETFVRTFLRTEVQDRWLQFLPSPKNRGKVLHRLAHTFEKDLKLQYLHDPRTMSSETAAKVKALLRQGGRGQEPLCHVMGDAGNAIGRTGVDRDGKQMSLAEALETTIDTIGVVLIVIPDRLAYYRGEDDLNKKPFSVLYRDPEL